MNMCSTFRSTILCNSSNIWKEIFDNVWGASLIRCHIQNTKARCDWKNSLLHEYNFQFDNEALWLFCCEGNGKVKKREERGCQASHSTHLGRAQTLPDGISWGHVYETEWLHQPNPVCCLTHSHILSHRPIHTQKTRHNPTHSSQPTPFSPNISIMKASVIFMSSDSAGAKNEVLVSCIHRLSSVQCRDRKTTMTPPLLASSSLFLLHLHATDLK